MHIGQGELSGLVIKAMSGYATVLVDGEEILCQPRGRFKLQREAVLSGDNVLIKLSGSRRGVITDVLPRKTILARPPVANVERVIVVFTLRQPPLDLEFLDRVLAQAELGNVEPVICLNKTDLLEPGESDVAISVYRDVGYRVYQTSAIACSGVDALKPEIKGTVTVLAGQSGVGKSKLAGCLKPDWEFRSSRVQEKTGRGRHTTKWVELLSVDDGWLVDTPGFQRLQFDPMRPEELEFAFPEIRRAATSCQFTDCLHKEEPGCAVVSGVSRGEIAKSRYENYLTFLGEVVDTWKKRY